MPQGTIKKLSADKGFGVINQIGSRDESFFHHTTLIDTNIEEFSEGQMVEYEVVQSDRGPRAENVRVISTATGRQVNTAGDP